MTEPDGMYGEDIRHALSAVADLVVPAGDGLAKIRRRTRHRPPAFAWLYAYATYLPRILIVSFRVPASELVLMAKGQSTLPKRVRARLRGQGKPGSPHAWLRPALAAAGALLMVVTITLAVPGLRQTVTTSALNSTSTNSGSGGGNNSSLGAEQASGASQRLPTSSGSGKLNLTMPPVGLLSNCPGTGGSNPSSGSGGSTYIPPTGSSPTESAGVNGNDIIAPSQSDTTLHSGAKNQDGSVRCSRSHSTSPSSSSSPSSPGGPTSSPTGSSSPSSPSISPSGGGTPTPTGTAITDNPSPTDTDTGGMGS